MIEDVYQVARAIVCRMPHHDLVADAEDAAHDTVVSLLERGQWEGVRNWEALVTASLARSIRWASMARGRAVHRRHYGQRPCVVQWDAGVHGDRGTPRLEDAIAGVTLFGRACRAWGKRASWVPWAWVLVNLHGWTAWEIAQALGYSAGSPITAQLARFEQGWR